jgi:hypothetical protein
MSGQRGTVQSFGPFDLSTGNRLLTNGAKVVSLASSCDAFFLGEGAMSQCSPTRFAARHKCHRASLLWACRDYLNHASYRLCP